MVHDIGVDIVGYPGRSLRSIIPFQDPLAAEIVRALAGETQAGPAGRLLVDSLATALAVRLLHRNDLPAPRLASGHGLPEVRLRRVLDYVEAHLGEELTLAAIAAVACYTPTHFSRSFKLAAGVGLARYVTLRRVGRAKLLLRQPGQSVAGIAQAVGFNDQSYFTKVFRRETGITPGQFRAAIL